MKGFDMKIQMMTHNITRKACATCEFFTGVRTVFSPSGRIQSLVVQTGEFICGAGRGPRTFGNYCGGYQRWQPLVADSKRYSAVGNKRSSAIMKLFDFLNKV